MEQQLGNLNDEVENLKAEKKKLRAVLDEKESAIKSKDVEITNLEREVKSLIQVCPTSLFLAQVTRVLLLSSTHELIENLSYRETKIPLGHTIKCNLDVRASVCPNRLVVSWNTELLNWAS